MASQLYCSEIELPYVTSLIYHQDASIWRSLGPNGLGNMESSLTSGKWQMVEFLERCMSDFYLQSLKAILATKLYELETNKSLKEITQLVPKYLPTVPIDAMTGDVLLFGEKKRWFYSRGSNFKDNGGSLESIYNDVCNRQHKCRNSPTVTIDYTKNPDRSHSYYKDH